VGDYDEKEQYALQQVLGGGANAVPMPSGMYMRRSKLERLHDARKGLEGKLAEVNKAISLLEANPQINEIIEALEKAGV